MGQVIYLRRTRLYCGNCGARHSTVTHDKKTRTTTAVCDSTKGGCARPVGGGTEHRTAHLCPECYEDYEAGLIQFTAPGLRVVRVASIDKCDNHSSG